MAEHYPKSTISVTVFCTKCKDFTQHNVSDGRRGACQRCLQRLDRENEEARTRKAEEAAEASRQYGLF